MKYAVVSDIVKVHAFWHFEHLRRGKLLWQERSKNLIVDQGLTYMLSASLDSSTPKIANWYVGIYKANRAPLATDTGASYPGDASEATEYSQAARPAFTGVVDTGPPLIITNAAARAEFTFTAAITVYGGFMISLAPKGIGGGTLFNARPFSSGPRSPIIDDVLRVTVQVGLAGA